jgi:hypothetical protein
MKQITWESKPETKKGIIKNLKKLLFAPAPQPRAFLFFGYRQNRNKANQKA